METDKQLLKDNKTELPHHDSMNPETKKYEDIGELCVELEHQNGRLNNEVARLRELMRQYIDFVDENLGTTADWPMEAAFDDETTAQRHCDLLNAMKREVKPEDIN